MDVLLTLFVIIFCIGICLIFIEAMPHVFAKGSKKWDKRVREYLGEPTEENDGE